MLDISAVEYKNPFIYDNKDFIYYIKDDKIYRASDILDATEPGCNIVTLDFVNDLIHKWNICRIFKSNSIRSFIDTWNNRSSPIYSIITDFMLIKGKISNIEKLYNRLEQEMPEVIKIDNDIYKFRECRSKEPTIKELKQLVKQSIYVSKIDLLYYFSMYDIIKADKNIFYCRWSGFVDKNKIYHHICTVLEMNKNSSSFRIIDSHLKDDNKIVHHFLINAYAQLIQMELLEEMK